MALPAETQAGKSTSWPSTRLTDTTVWTPLPGWPHTVDLATGRIRSAAGRILSSRPNNRPAGAPPERRYQLVTLCAAGRKETRTVHTCVDAAKHGSWCPPGLEVCHLDDHPGHNWAGNLARGTHGENERMKSEETRRRSAQAGRAAQLERMSPPVFEHVSMPWWRRVLRALRGDRP